jgi:beta-galactosidase
MNRIVEDLNAGWLFSPRDSKAGRAFNCDESAFTRITLPHTNVELPYHCFPQNEFGFVSLYRRHFRVQKQLNHRRVFVEFDGVMIAATVYVNGKQVAPEHRGGYTPFSVDITEFVNAGGDNVLAVRVDSTERPDIPPYGHVVDYLTFGGIYRDVRLRICDPIYIEHAFARPGDALAKKKRIDVTLRVVNTLRAGRRMRVSVEIPKLGRRSAWKDVDIPANGKVDVDLAMTGLTGARPWSLEEPNLYRLQAQIDDAYSMIDRVEHRIGWRTAEFRDDGAFYLNDKPLKLRGLNRHQTYPYIGAAAPARLQRKDADILRFDLACNIVRTSHYPQSPHFLDRCDEIGLLVFEEIPGWQHLGDAAWKELVVRDVEAMIVRDRNRPSIILWGVRVNESNDDHELYARTNALAHELDPTRQTGGVRYKYDSQRLEDVFTMNDFGYDLRPPNHPKYLVTEFCGHLYPTKTFDQEERVRQHAIHHVHVHNQIDGARIAGGIGWCAFDYNTHLDFGSGDLICYHGVMDIFRQPKLASYFYAAQHDPAYRVVLEPATYWKMGDKAGGGVEPLIIFTNCDEVEILIGNNSRGRFKPDRETYPNIPRPPIIARGLSAGWGMDWKPLELRGFIGGKHVATKKVSHDGNPARLEMTADDQTIAADGADMTRIGLRIVDRFSNILPFAMQPVMLEIKGAGVLVGDNPHPMPGGRGAVYVRSTLKPGKITITATTARLKPQTVTIRTVASRGKRAKTRQRPAGVST